MAIVRRGGGERGASLVEFAIILPIFMMLVLGMFSGGVAYNKKQEMTHASREGARFGATVPAASSGSTWASTVRNVVTDVANGEIAAGDVCVALVRGANGSIVYAQSVTPSNFHTTNTSGFPANCFDDNDTGTGARVHVAVRGSSNLEFLVASRSVDLTSRAVSRYERTLPE